MDELTGASFPIRRNTKTLDEVVSISYKITEAPSMFEIKFQCDKSKYAFIMGAKHQIKQKLKEAKRCEERFRIGGDNPYESSYSYRIQRLTNNGYNVFQIKRAVDNNMATLDFPKKSHWRLQT